MFILVIGGAASGKSAFAESLACKGASPRVYVATMQSVDTECEKRIARHRQMRAGKGFTTLECPSELENADIWGKTVLLECLSKDYPGLLEERYGIEESDPLPMLEQIAENRKCIQKGGQLDYSKAANIILEEFRNGKIGKITLEMPPAQEQ